MKCVYFIRAAEPVGLIKIGCTRMPAQRLSALLTWAPVALTIEAMAPGRFCDEAAVQAKFSDDHSHGEWFRPSPDLNAFIEAVKATGELPDLPVASPDLMPKNRANAAAKQSVLLRATSAEKKMRGVYAPISNFPRPDFRPPHVHDAMARWSATTDVSSLVSERETILQYAADLRAAGRKAAA